MSTRLMFLQILLCLLGVINGAWIDNYNTQWTEPGLTQWGSLPLCNGDLTASYIKSNGIIKTALEYPLINNSILLTLKFKRSMKRHLKSHEKYFFPT